jgi:2-oxoisovalerate dehydrogenase E1 component beta subunit
MTTATVGKEVSYLEAISQALDEEMARDERVFLMGEDIGTYGGAFKITEGFQEKYGQWRVLDTPLSESGFVGAAIGAAMMGLRPVVEMQFADFISCAFDQITEVAAKNHYRWGAAVPMVIRAPFGAACTAGPSTRNARRAGFSIRRDSSSWPPPRPTMPKASSRLRFATPIPSFTSSTNSSIGA